MRQPLPRSRPPRRPPVRRYLRLLSPLAALLFTAALLAGCGANGHGSTRAGQAGHAGGSAADVIVIKNFAYSPSSLTVSPGTVITVRNEDTATHTLTATDPHSGAFNTGDIKPGSSATFKAPSAPGTYPYICLIHQFMHGTLAVS